MKGGVSMAIDPVCKMAVEEAKATATSEAEYQAHLWRDILN